MLVVLDASQNMLQHRLIVKYYQWEMSDTCRRQEEQHYVISIMDSNIRLPYFRLSRQLEQTKLAEHLIVL